MFVGQLLVLGLHAYKQLVRRRGESRPACGDEEEPQLLLEKPTPPQPSTLRSSLVCVVPAILDLLGSTL